jgi:hypothetical protein
MRNISISNAFLIRYRSTKSSMTPPIDSSPCKHRRNIPSTLPHGFPELSCSSSTRVGPFCLPAPMYFGSSTVRLVTPLLEPLITLCSGALHELASIGSSAIWLIITAILWGVAAGLFHPVRGGGNCAGEPAISPYVVLPSLKQLIDLMLTPRCRETLALEAIGWTEMGLCILTLLAACFWVRSSRRSYVSPAFF